MTESEVQLVDGLRSVLLITDDGDFRRKVMELWTADENAPLLVVVGSDLPPRFDVTHCDLAVLGPVRPENLATGLAAAATAPSAIAFVPWGVSVQQVHAAHHNVLTLHETEDSPAVCVMLGRSFLRRAALERQVVRAEVAIRDTNRQASLGRYMIESRHSFSNALTSVLGTAELLLLPETQLPDAHREQVNVIRTMAMRMHQMIVRFNALESEMRIAEAKAIAERALDVLPAMAPLEARQ